MTGDYDLGYLRDYGHWIISGILIIYGILYTYLSKEYESIDD